MRDGGFDGNLIRSLSSGSTGGSMVRQAWSAPHPPQGAPVPVTTLPTAHLGRMRARPGVNGTRAGYRWIAEPSRSRPGMPHRARRGSRSPSGGIRSRLTGENVRGGAGIVPGGRRDRPGQRGTPGCTTEPLGVRSWARRRAVRIVRGIPQEPPLPGHCRQRKLPIRNRATRSGPSGN